MGVTFSLELGYNSGHLGSHEWRVLQQVASKVIEECKANRPPHKLLETILYVGFDYNRYEETMREFICRYISSAYAIDEKNEWVTLSATGGGEYRVGKEQIALAFCLYIVMECAKQGTLVNVKSS